VALAGGWATRHTAPTFSRLDTARTHVLAWASLFRFGDISVELGADTLALVDVWCVYKMALLCCCAQATAEAFLLLLLLLQHEMLGRASMPQLFLACQAPNWLVQDLLTVV
jgi:hypothetical protein